MGTWGWFEVLSVPHILHLGKSGDRDHRPYNGGVLEENIRNVPESKGSEDKACG
jgi:hypothetical protein